VLVAANTLLTYLSPYEGIRNIDWTRGAVPRPVHQKHSDVGLGRYPQWAKTASQNAFDGPEIGSTVGVVFDQTVR